MKKTKHKKRVVLVLAGLVIVAVAAAVLFSMARPLRDSPMESNYPTEYSDLVEDWAREYGVDPYLVYAVIRTESGFQADAASNAGAIGLMQMTEDTFDWIKGQIAPGEALVFEDLYTPETSIRFGVYYLSRCLSRYGGDISTAAAAYHSGWGTVDTLLADGGNTSDGVQLTAFPYEQMNHYVNKINSSYQNYNSIYNIQAKGNTNG